MVTLDEARQIVGRTLFVTQHPTYNNIIMSDNLKQWFDITNSTESEVKDIIENNYKDVNVDSTFEEVVSRVLSPWFG